MPSLSAITQSSPLATARASDSTQVVEYACVISASIVWYCSASRPNNVKCTTTRHELVFRLHAGDVVRLTAGVCDVAAAAEAGFSICWRDSWSVSEHIDRGCHVWAGPTDRRLHAWSYRVQDRLQLATNQLASTTLKLLANMLLNRLRRSAFAVLVCTCGAGKAAC